MTDSLPLAGIESPVDSLDDNLPPLTMPAPLDLTKMRKVLVFIPHPDDEVIGCGGLIAQLQDLNTPVHLVLVSDGSGDGGLPPGAGDQRMKEFYQAVAQLGSNISQECWQLPDGHLSASPDLAQRIRQCIRKYQPTTLLAPWLRDLHPDHAILGKHILHAVRHAPGDAHELLFYEVWSPLPATHILDISHVWPKKQAALACHKTALSCGDYQRAMASLAAYRSLLSVSLAREGHYAEAYRRLDLAALGDGIKARYPRSEDGPAISQLFSRVFEQPVPSDWWQQKYGMQPQAGALAENADGDIVGYYGAMYRQGCWQGADICSAQQGDVMVAPGYRFATRSKGVFLRISSLFLRNQLGPQQTYQFAYGFPTPRALQLGIRLGLYRQGDLLGYWRCTNHYSRMGVGWQSRCQPCHKINNWHWVDHLQPFMAAPEHTFWLKKTSAYWQQRYKNATPQGKRYHMMRLYRWGRLQAVAIVRLDVDGIEIIDLAKAGQHPDAAPKMISAIINYGVRRNLQQTTAWGTRLAVEELCRLAETLHQSGQHKIDHAGFMALPAPELNAPVTEQIAGHCWMLGGDTDFR